MLEKTKKISLSALFIALGLVLPLLTGQLKGLGNAFLPMHLPVLIMPPLYPTAIAMSFELATYGFVIGFVYKTSRWKCIIALYESLIIAMIAGRIVWGITTVILLGVNGQAFAWQKFIEGAVLNAIPGIVFQLILIPSLMLALHKTGLVQFRYNSNKVKEAL